MFLYVINVDACIHVENYRIFFYEPVAQKKLELFEAAWNIPSLTQAFLEIAARIDRRGFNSRDYQVVVCARRRESDRIRETTLYAKAMVSEALERSGMIPVITGAYTRKVTVLFQVEQPYYGTVPKTSVWEEEQNGIWRLLEVLGLSPEDAGVPKILEDALREVLEHTIQGDSVLAALQKRLLDALEQDIPEEDPAEEELLGELPPVSGEIFEEEFWQQDSSAYISHRLRSLMDGSGFNRCTEVIYWPVLRRVSRSSRVAMLCMVELLRNGREVTRERVEACFPEHNPDYEERLLARYRKALAGYRRQLSEKRQLLQQEDIETQEEKGGQEDVSDSLPEPSAAFHERLESAKQQLESCGTSLTGSRRKEIGERVEEISQSLAGEFNGLEAELAVYERETAAYLYRAVEGDPCVGRKIAGMDTKEGPWKNDPSPFDEQKRGLDEKAAAGMILQWKQDMALLTECAGLTKPASTAVYLLISMAAAIIPYALTQGASWSSRDSLLSSLAAFGLLAAWLLAGRVGLAGFFIRRIADSYRELEKRLMAVLDAYRARASLFWEESVSWLESEKRLERKAGEFRAQKEHAALASRRAWHISAMKKALDGLETFQTMEDGYGEDVRDPEVTRRILMPFNYSGDELDNAVYWPVIPQEREEEADE